MERLKISRREPFATIGRPSPSPKKMPRGKSMNDECATK